jgi:hypothetical protein
MERSTGNLRRIVEALDDAGLRMGKPISRKFAAQVLDNISLSAQDKT